MAAPRDSLEILSLFHYAVGALLFMIALVPFALHLVGSAMADPAAVESVRRDGERVSSRFTPGCAAVAIAVGALGGAGIGRTGYDLARRRRYRRCLAAAGLECLFVPAGTFLGAATIWMLLRPEIRSLFPDAPPESGASPSAGPPADPR